MLPAPAAGYLRDSLKAQIGFGYVFQRWQTTTTYYYAALRVTALTHQFVIFDWSIQTNPGNPDLAAPRFAVPPGGSAPARAPGARARPRARTRARPPSPRAHTPAPPA